MWTPSGWALCCSLMVLSRRERALCLHWRQVEKKASIFQTWTRGHDSDRPSAVHTTRGLIFVRSLSSSQEEIYNCNLNILSNTIVQRIVMFETKLMRNNNCHFTENICNFSCIMLTFIQAYQHRLRIINRNHIKSTLDKEFSFKGTLCKQNLKPQTYCLKCRTFTGIQIGCTWTSFLILTGSITDILTPHFETHCP